MTSGAGFPRVSKAELLGLLAKGHAARVGVVTPNLRLAAALRREFDARQIAGGLSAWEAADILPLSAFVERLHEDALYSELATTLPLLLTAAQEQALWEDTVRSSEAGAALLSAPPAAALAREAWQLTHAWRLAPRLKGYPANDDARAYADWAWRYEGATRRDRQCDRARLADVVMPHLAHAALRKPSMLVAYGFDILNPQQREFLVALAQVGVKVLACGPEARASQARRVSFPSARDEIRAAACWARSRLEAAHAVASSPDGPDPGTQGPPPAFAQAGHRGGDRNAVSASVPRIGVVVPDIADSRREVQRIFAQVLAPGHALPGGESATLPFNISFGEPLSSRPLVAAALRVLELAHSSTAGEVEFSRASRLIRSPFIAGGESERVPRARLDAELRETCAASVGLEPLRRMIAKLTAKRGAGRGAEGSVSAQNRLDTPILARLLGELSRAARELLHGARRPGEWARAFSALLDAAGFPGERTLDSAEYQTLKKFHEAIASFAAIERVAGRMRAEEALGRFARIAADTPFQPEAPQVPVQVLGVLESAGLEFDHLWVMGLTDEAWPIPARPNPFIPVALQRAAGVPEASAAASFELDARITQGWLAAAGEVVLSHALAAEDRELAASPLLRDIPAASVEDLALPGYETLRERIHRARREERVEDARGPAIGAAGPDPRTAAPAPRAAALPLSAAATGGTAVFKDQAACPFRAFAMHRLHAEGLRAPSTGLDAAERGTLVHAMLAHAWRELKSKARLDAATGDVLDALLADGADNAIERLRRRRPDAIDGRYAELEKERLMKLGRAWLEFERARAPFEVVAIEHKRTASFGGVTVSAKLDRVDRLLAQGRADGAGALHAVIDYKTGVAGVGDWLGERPDDPQLPLYAVSGAQDMGEVCAVTFARVKAGDMAFKGVARDEGLIPGVATLDKLRAGAARDYGSWEELLAGWRSELEAIGREFAAGEARVDPKRGELTCRYCELKPLCRINERANGRSGADRG